MNRYSRQEHVAVMGASSSELLADAHVLIIGAGGLGSPVSLYLAGAGVGEISLVDSDAVSLSNLHRQILFEQKDIGHPKVECAKSRLNALNNDIKINAINTKLTPENVHSLMSGVTVVVDAADNFLVSYLLSDTCFQKRIPLVSASVISTHGYLGVFCGTQAKPAPSMRAVFSTPSGPSQNCNTAGVTGPSVGIIGSYQAQETLKVIVNDSHQLLGKLMYIEAWNYQHNIVDFNDAKEPSSHAPIIDIKRLSDNDILIDVRTAQECADVPMVSSAVNISLQRIQEEGANLDASKRIVCLCASGQRALMAADFLLKKGFEKVAVTSR